MTFNDLVAQACSGVTPYPYQMEFAEGASLPEILIAPTGAGKTVTIGLGYV